MNRAVGRGVEVSLESEEEGQIEVVIAGGNWN